MTVYKYQEIVNIFINKKCELLTLEKDYVPSMTLDYKCECGNINKIKLANFQLRTVGCKKCAGKKRSINSNEECIKLCNQYGCEFLNRILLDKAVKIRFKCKCGDITEKSIDNFKKFVMCVKCTYALRGASKRNTLEYIKQEFEKKNCKLITTEYINAFQRLDYICSCGNKAKIRYNELQQGIKCRKCQIERRIETNLEKYGCEFAVQHIDTLHKIFVSTHKWKIYKYNNGVEVKVQGYEPLALSLLECKHKLKQEDIITQFDNEIYYTFTKRYHKYFPDIYIKSLNKIIEVKSDYTYIKALHKNILKKKACLYLGYKFEFWIFDGKHNLTII